MKATILLCLSLAVFPAFAEDSELSSPNNSVPQEGMWPKELTEKWLSYMEKAKIKKENHLALIKAQQKYFTAIGAAGDTLSNCRGTTEDTKWIERATVKFGVEKIKSLNKDFRYAISSVWTKNIQTCVENSEKDVLYYEKKYFDLLIPRLDELKKFNATLSSSEKKQLSPVLKQTVEVQKNGAPYSQLIALQNRALVIERIDTLDKEVRDFVNSDPAFSKLFRLSETTKPLKEKPFVD